MHPERRITDVDPERLAVRTADGRTDAADALVIAAGPGRRGSCRHCAAASRRRARSRSTSSRPRTSLAAWRAAPMVLDQFEAARGGFYAVPPVDGTRLKVGDHVFTLRGEPDASASRPRPTARRR